MDLLLGCFLLVVAIGALLIVVALMAADPLGGLLFLAILAPIFWWAVRSTRRRAKRDLDTSVRHYGPPSEPEE